MNIDTEHAENALLNIIYTDYPQAAMLVDSLYPEIFSNIDRQSLFTVLRKRRIRQESTDIILLRSDVADLGGDPYVVDQVAREPLETIGISEYVEKLVDGAKRRMLQRIITQAAQGDKIDADGLQRRIEVEFSRIESVLAPKLRSIGIRDAIQEYRTREVQLPFSTGFKAMDDLTNKGLRLGEVTLLVAAPNVGKSILGGQIAMNVARMTPSPGHVFVVSAEMRIDDLIGRWLSADAQMPSEDYDHILFNKMEGSPIRSRFERSLEEIAHGQMSLMDVNRSRVIGTDEIGGEVRALNRKLAEREQPPISLVIVDYLQLLDYEVSRGQSLANALGAMAMRIKRIALLHNCHIILVAALRKINGREMTIDDIRDSGEITYHVDNILGMTDRADLPVDQMGREWQDGVLRMIDVKALKVRKGAKTTLRSLVFRGNIQYLRDPSREEKSFLIGTETRSPKENGPSPVRAAGRTAQ